MALYNAFRYNYSDMTGCSLIIDIGARTTNLIFIEPNKVFSRSIVNQGGNTITQAIAKDFSEPFVMAEERKKRDGFVSLGGSYADPDDPEVARVSKIVRNTMTRLHAEIARSISFYRSQQHGQSPVRVLLCGGTASLPYMREFFHEKLQLPVEYFNPLRNVAVESTHLNSGRRRYPRSYPRGDGGSRTSWNQQLPDGVESPSGERRESASVGRAAPLPYRGWHLRAPRSNGWMALL